MRKILAAFAFALLLVSPVLADDLEDLINLVKTDLQAERHDVITKGMQTFTDEEAKRFWPIYDAYSAELAKFFDARVALTKDYADNYDTMTDAKAQQLLNRRFDQIKQRAKLDEQYRPKFATALSPRRLVRFYQIEHQLQELMDLRAVIQIPKMKWWQGE